MEELKKAYEQALKENKETFVFDGKILATSYAKYLLEYLQSYYSKTPNYGNK